MFVEAREEIKSLGINLLVAAGEKTMMPKGKRAHTCKTVSAGLLSIVPSFKVGTLSGLRVSGWHGSKYRIAPH
jgi:hypothetical protein